MSAGGDYRTAVDLKNLLGRDLTFYDSDGEYVGELEADGRVWVTSDYEQIGDAALSEGPDASPTVHRIPLVRAVHERVVGLPDPLPGVLYVVSGLVAAMESYRRDDLVCPSQMVRSSGRVLGPRSLLIR